MDWLVRGCSLLSINAERNIIHQGMKLPILYDPLEIMTWYFHKKIKKKERKGKQTRRKWFAKCYIKAETLLHDESQRIPTKNLLVKTNMAFNDRFKSTPYNLNLIGKSKNVPLIASLKQITKKKERRWGRNASITSRGARNIDWHFETKLD